MFASVITESVRAQESSQAAPFESRVDFPTIYPEPFPVPAALRPWGREFTSYRPIFFERQVHEEHPFTSERSRFVESSEIGKNEFVRRKAAGELCSFEGEIALDSLSGRPLNPWGRTGLCGRGTLSQWGANFKAEILLTRVNQLTGELEALLEERVEGIWGIPGDMRAPGETAQQNIARTIQKEFGGVIDPQRVRLVYEGMEEGFEATDNAWVEASLFHMHLSTDECALVSQNRRIAGTSQFAWIPITKDLMESLPSFQRSMLHTTLAQMSAVERDDPVVRTCFDRLPGGNLLTNFNNLHGRIGIYGGTFDPMHYGIVRAGEKAAAAERLDAIICIPTQQNPTKMFQPGASGHERIEMLMYGMKSEAHTFVSPIEIRKAGPSYTVETLRDIRAQLPADAEIFFIIGSDCMMQLPEWREIDEIRRMVTFVPILRIDENPPDAHALAERVGVEFAQELLAHLVTTDPGVESSSLVRARIAAGCSFQDLVPPAVYHYIEERHLYDCGNNA